MLLDELNFLLWSYNHETTHLERKLRYETLNEEQQHRLQRAISQANLQNDSRIGFIADPRYS